MKTTLSLTLAAALVLSVLGQISANAAEPAPSRAKLAPVTNTSVNDDTSVSNKELGKNALSLELLGRGLLYSFNYDRMISDDVALGVGVSHYSISSGDSSASAWIVPVYANYYFTGGNSRWFATGGANLVFASGSIGSDSKVSGSGVAGVLGAGYEYRADNGFLFRAAPYVFVGQTSGAWLGVSLGFTI